MMHQANVHQSGHSVRGMINCYLEWLFTLLAHVAHRDDGSAPSKVIDTIGLWQYGQDPAVNKTLRSIRLISDKLKEDVTAQRCGWL